VYQNTPSTEGIDDFQEPDKIMNVLFGELPNRRSQKATRREALSIEPAVPTLLRWSEVPITFYRTDQWTSFSKPGHFPLVLKPVVVGSRLNKVLIDGGSGLNILFTKTLKKMKLDITHMLTKSTSPFYGIVPGNAAIPLGSVVLPVTFGRVGRSTTPSTSSSRLQTSRLPNMASSADRVSPSSWRYPTVTP
jgi:hypothetical protein